MIGSPNICSPSETHHDLGKSLLSTCRLEVLKSSTIQGENSPCGPSTLWSSSCSFIMTYYNWGTYQSPTASSPRITSNHFCHTISCLILLLCLILCQIPSLQIPPEPLTRLPFSEDTLTSHQVLWFPLTFQHYS